MKVFKANLLRLIKRTKSSSEFLSLFFGFIVGYCFVELLVLSTPFRPHWMNYIKNFDAELLNYSSPDQKEYKRLQDDKYINSDITAKLYEEVRVLCWILTSPKNHEIRAGRIKQTWGKHCNKLLLMSTKKAENLATIALNVSEGHFHRWGKTKAAFEYIYKNHFDEAEWFLKADDESYIVLENLRYMLFAYSPETAIYFGYKYKRFLKQNFIIGGANYVLSKEALRRFVLEALPQSKYCRHSTHGAEDVEMAKCLAYVNVTTGETRDSQGRARFIPYFLDYHIVQHYKGKSPLYWQQHKISENAVFPDCCSDQAISFANVPAKQMAVLHYMIYYLRPYGILYNPKPLPKRMKSTETVEYQFVGNGSMNYN